MERECNKTQSFKKEEEIVCEKVSEIISEVDERIKERKENFKELKELGVRSTKHRFSY